MTDKKWPHAQNAIVGIMVTLPLLSPAATSVVTVYRAGVEIHNADEQTCGTTAHKRWAIPVGTSLLHGPEQETVMTERMRVADPRPTGQKPKNWPVRR